MPSRPVDIPMPLGGLSDALPLEGQTPTTTVRAINVRGTDPVTGRRRLSKRSGTKRWASDVRAYSGQAMGIQRMVQVTYEDNSSSVAYENSAAFGTDNPVWSQSTSANAGVTNCVTDDSGNVYVVTGTNTLEKYNPDGALVWTKLVPVDSGDELRALAIDLDGTVFTAVSESNRNASKVWAYEQTEDGVELRWTLNVTGTVPDMHCAGSGRLYILRNTTSTAALDAYSSLAASAPGRDWTVGVPRPASQVRESVTGDIFVTCDETAKRLEDPPTTFCDSASNVAWEPVEGIDSAIITDTVTSSAIGTDIEITGGSTPRLHCWIDPIFQQYTGAADLEIVRYLQDYSNRSDALAAAEGNGLVWFWNDARDSDGPVIRKNVSCGLPMLSFEFQEEGTYPTRLRNNYTEGIVDRNSAETQRSAWPGFGNADTALGFVWTGLFKLGSTDKRQIIMSNRGRWGSGPIYLLANTASDGTHEPGSICFLFGGADATDGQVTSGLGGSLISSTSARYTLSTNVLGTSGTAPADVLPHSDGTGGTPSEADYLGDDTFIVTLIYLNGDTGGTSGDSQFRVNGSIIDEFQANKWSTDSECWLGGLWKEGDGVLTVDWPTPASDEFGYFDGYFGEMMTWTDTSGALDTQLASPTTATWAEQIAQVSEGYLAWKWKKSGILDDTNNATGHFYGADATKNNAPPNGTGSDETPRSPDVFDSPYGILAKFNSAGVRQWAYTSNGVGWSLALDEDGGVYTTGPTFKTGTSGRIHNAESTTAVPTTANPTATGKLGQDGTFEDYNNDGGSNPIVDIDGTAWDPAGDYVLVRWQDLGDSAAPTTWVGEFDSYSAEVDWGDGDGGGGNDTITRTDAAQWSPALGSIPLTNEWIRVRDSATAGNDGTYKILALSDAGGSNDVIEIPAGSVVSADSADTITVEIVSGDEFPENAVRDADGLVATGGPKVRMDTARVSENNYYLQLPIASRRDTQAEGNTESTTATATVASIRFANTDSAGTPTWRGSLTFYTESALEGTVTATGNCTAVNPNGEVSTDCSGSTLLPVDAYLGIPASLDPVSEQLANPDEPFNPKPDPGENDSGSNRMFPANPSLINDDALKFGAGGTGAQDSITTLYYYHFATVAAATNLRDTKVVVVTQGEVYQLDTDGTNKTAATNGTGSAYGTGNPLDHTQSYIAGMTMFNEAYFADGEVYKRWCPFEGAGGTLLDWTASGAGQIPPGGRLLGQWGGRAVVARLGGDPHNWAMSEYGEPRGWDFAPPVTLATQAVLGSDSRVGVSPDIINAVIPYSDDLLIFGGDKSIHRMSGDPMAGGRFHLVSDITGIAFGDAWCKDDGGAIYFAGSLGGVYRMAPEGVTEISRMGADRDLRLRLSDFDYSTYRVVMHWNNDDEAVHLFLCPKEAYGSVAPGSATTGTITHYVWERRTGAWWSDQFADTDLDPTAVLALDTDNADDRRMLIGTRASQIVKWDRSTPADDDDVGGTDTIMATECWVGPLYPRNGALEARWSHWRSIFADNTGYTAPDLAGYASDYAVSDVTALSPTFSYTTLATGRNQALGYNLTGEAVYLKLSSSGATGDRWSVERITADLEPAGRAAT